MADARWKRTYVWSKYERWMCVWKIFELSQLTACDKINARSYRHLCNTNVRHVMRWRSKAMFFAALVALVYQIPNSSHLPKSSKHQRRSRGRKFNKMPMLHEIQLRLALAK